MIRRFANAGTEDIFNGKNSRAARLVCPRGLWKVAARKLDQLDSVDAFDDLKAPPGNRLEALSGVRKGQFSIRINEKYRICFKWESEGPTDVEILDYHR